MSQVKAKLEKDSLFPLPKESSEAVTHTSNSAPPPKSPKGKRTKKEEDLKLQEEAEKQQQEIENAKKLSQCQNIIRKLLKEIESVKNLFVTTPDGLHVSFLHSIVVPTSDDINKKEKSFVLKLQRIVNECDDVTLEGREAVTEIYRCVTDEGKVIKVCFIINSTNILQVSILIH